MNFETGLYRECPETAPPPLKKITVTLLKCNFYTANSYEIYFHFFILFALCKLGTPTEKKVSLFIYCKYKKRQTHRFTNLMKHIKENKNHKMLK